MAVKRSRDRGFTTRGSEIRRSRHTGPRTSLIAYALGSESQAWPVSTRWPEYASDPGRGWPFALSGPHFTL
eukprot:166611-Rhodomonas_salina.2